MPREPLLGAHVSTAGGIHTAYGRAETIGCQAMQIFVKNNMQWFAGPLSTAEVRLFRDHPHREAIRSVFGHTGYLINLAATNPGFLENSRRALREELIRADLLGLPFMVLHPGAHMGAGEEAGVQRVAESIDAVFAAAPKVRTRIAPEITAGQGTCLGHRFEHLAGVIAAVREPERLGVCLDTAHLFAAGYDISTTAGVRAVFRSFDTLIGADRLVALHLNDSKVPLGARVDRHEHIGKGRIGLDAFRYLMTAKRFQGIPKVLETPKGKEMREDVENMALLRSLMKPRLKSVT